MRTSIVMLLVLIVGCFMLSFAENPAPVQRAHPWEEPLMVTESAPQNLTTLTEQQVAEWIANGWLKPETPSQAGIMFGHCHLVYRHCGQGSWCVYCYKGTGGIRCDDCEVAQ